MQDEVLAQKLVERYEALKQLRQPWESVWEQIASMMITRRLPGMKNALGTLPDTTNDARLFDTTAGRALMTLANGQLAWMSPQESPWSSFTAPQKASEQVKRFLSDCTTTAQEMLATSSFYTEVHESYIDRAAFGTSCLYVEPGKKKGLNVQCWPCGTYVIDSDDEGNIDTVIREMRLTPRQAEQRFGQENLSPKVLKMLKDGGAKLLEKIVYLHAIYPRLDAERDKMRLDGMNLPVASVYLEYDSKYIAKVSGYEEQPFMVSRYLTWGTECGALYGWSPAFMALPEARQVNFMQKMMDALGEKMAFPPVLAPSDFEGEIDFNAFGITYYNNGAEGAAKPQEWMTGGKYDVGLQRIQERQKAINDAFHVDLFQMFAQIQKQMTAREVAERSQEKLIQFSPTFARLTVEMFNPLLERLFGIMLRAGKLGAPDQVPQELLIPLGDGLAMVASPKVQYSSRIALSLKALPTLGYNRTLERLVSLAAAGVPGVMDYIDFDKSEPDTALLDGVPADYIRPMAQVQEMRAARAKAEQEQAAQQQALAQSQAVKNVSGITPDSVAGRILESGINQQQAA